MLFKKTNSKKQLTKCISIYISEKHRQIIIAPKYQDKNGIIYEQENCLVLDLPASSLVLGMEVINNLNLFTLQECNKQNLKLTCWPAYRTSRSKSVRTFENEYISISVDSLNNYNLVLEIRGYPFKDSELTINSTISYAAEKEEIGKRIMKIYEACITGQILSTGG